MTTTVPGDLGMVTYRIPAARIVLPDLVQFFSEPRNTRARFTRASSGSSRPCTPSRPLTSRSKRSHSNAASTRRQNPASC